MLTTFLGNFLKAFLLFVILGIIIIAVFVESSKFLLRQSEDTYIKPTTSLPTPKISGWIAWWAEKAAYDLLQRNPGKIQTVSPVWFMLDKNLNFSEVGTVNKKDSVTMLKNSNVRILPTFGSELTEDKLSPFLNNSSKVDKLTDTLAQKAKELGVNGLDIDIEGIRKEDKNAFISFLQKMSQKLKKEGLIMSVDVSAQTQIVVWKGVEGQDLKRIGQIADEVRIMLYDEHSSSTKPGPISSKTWIEDVALYTLGQINKDKIVMGIPSYGYIWNKNGNSEGLQFDEFNKYLSDKKYTSKRDSNSAELVITGDNFSGWLSDSEAMHEKIKILRQIGLNKFIIWHLGGMDERFLFAN